MLTRVSCSHCGFLGLWTDDPKGFLRDACALPLRCTARIRLQVESTRVGSVERRASSTHGCVRVRPSDS